MAANILTDAARKNPWDASTYAYVINYGTDTFNFMLETTTGDSVSDANKRAVQFESDTFGPSGAGNEASGTGYTPRGMSPGGAAVTITSSVVKVTSSNPNWTTTTITAYGVWMVRHNSTNAAGICAAVAYYTFGGAVSSTAGTFTVAVNAAGLWTIT